MKKIDFKVMKKHCRIEATGNPNYFKSIISNDDMYKVQSFYATSIMSALYHTTIVAIGVK